MPSFRVFTADETEYWFHGDSSYRIEQGGALQVRNDDGKMTLFSPTGWTHLEAEEAEPVIDAQIL